MKTVSIIVLFFVGIILLGFAFGWIGTGADIVSPANVKKQWAEAYRNDTALKASALNVCGAEKLVAGATSDAERIARQSQLSAYEQNYARIASDYDAAVSNAFEAKFVKPGDLPIQAPTLAHAKAACE
jgi:hypothetical protein